MKKVLLNKTFQNPNMDDFGIQGDERPKQNVGSPFIKIIEQNNSKLSKESKIKCN